MRRSKLQSKNKKIKTPHCVVIIGVLVLVWFFITVVLHSLNGIFLKKVVRRSNIFDRSKFELGYLAHSHSWEAEKAPFLHILRINHYTALAILDSTTVKLQCSNNLWPSHGILNNSYHCFSQRKKKKALRYWACHRFLWNLGRNSKGFGSLSERKLPSPK